MISQATTQCGHGRLLVLATACALASCASGNITVAPKRMVVTPLQDARFVPNDPREPDGPQLAVLWGDPARGPSTMLVKVKKSTFPLHSHTADYHLVVLEGTVKHWAEGELESNAKALGPGSYWFQPGNQVHGDACVTDECLVHIHWAGPRDGKLAPVTK
jgi:quercetin dioxygenase-like cupin family protein